MSRTVWIMAEQLARNNSALAEVVRADRRTEPVRILMIESEEQCKRLPYHKHKLMLLFSAMRHFADELRRRGLEVDYYPIRADGSHRHRSFEDALRDHMHLYPLSELVAMEPAGFAMREEVMGIADSCGIALRLTPNTMFLTDRHAFAKEFADGGITLESHYLKLRAAKRILVEEGVPAGGTWLLGAAPTLIIDGTELPAFGGAFPQDAVTREVAACVNALFPGHPGSTADFNLPVTHSQANDLLDLDLNLNLDLSSTLSSTLPLPLTSSSISTLISIYLDLGLLYAPQVLKKIETAYYDGRLSLSVAEPLVREILGGREYRYGIHWLGVEEPQRRC